ncbi:MAG: hypothetical protein K6F05_02880 [Succinivibrio sp.]|nr:hypothetical protein [Succinivibrio sp.]
MDRSIKASLKSVLCMAGLLLSSAVSANAWDDYKSRFVTKEGAVVDTYNHNMTHSESQGYGLMFALAYDDKATFDLILDWTNTHIKNPKNNLFYWAYRPQEQDPTADKNNASDGDLFIAWALLKAHKKWANIQYARQAEQIATGLIRTVITKFAGKQVLLPGENGFYYNSSVVLNPSYFIFPAMQAIAQHTHLKRWQDLSNDCYEVVANVEKMDLKVILPPDWLNLDAQGKMIPAVEWPARSSYDAIRVPVYLYWMDPHNPHLKPWKDWFGRFPEKETPAWVNVATGETAKYHLTSGLKTVRDLVMGTVPLTEPVITAKDDYYNASLKLLCYLAAKHF